MNTIRIDPARQVAAVGAGARSRDVNRATDPHGLIAALGCHPDVGVAGLTLGGGLGWFLGRFGATCDNLLSANVIMADGARRHARPDDYADLFWALRGGGGNFGIVTDLELQLHPIASVLGGPIAFRTVIASFLRFYRDFMQAANDALTVEVSIVIVDQPVIMCTACWSGEGTDGVRALTPLRAFGPPVADGIRVMPYARLTDRPDPAFLAQAFGPPPSTSPPPAGPVFDYWKGGSIDGLTDRVIDQIAAAAQAASRGMSIGLGHYMHGRVCEPGAAHSPLPRKAGQLTYFFDANWRTAARADAAMAWVDRSWQSMQPMSAEGTYVNYLSRDDDAAVRAAYRSSYQRLVALKRRYDPANLFHRNRNIRP
jgi:FAD/FMN-containing dehydrogenase